MVGLGGTVVMTGVPEMTAQAGMGSVSRSTLGLDGSSEDQNTCISLYSTYGDLNTHISHYTVHMGT